MEVCKECSAGCCRSFSIDLTGFDILRISRTLGINPFFFVAALKVDDDKLERTRNNTAVFIFTDISEDKYCKLSLQKDLSKYFDSASKCMFLQEWDALEYGFTQYNGIIARCGIYDCRPLACRTFPTRLRGDNEAVILDPHIRIQKETGDFWKHEAHQLCPRPLTSDDFMKFRDDFIRNLTQNEFEVKFFQKLSEKWNKNPDVSDNFIKFIEGEYDNRIVYAPELV